PPVETAQIDHDLPFRIELDVRAVHRTRRRSLEVDPFRIISAAVAGTLKLVLACLPVGRAAQVRADRGDDEDTLGVAHHPDAILILKFRVDAKAEVGRTAYTEVSLRLIERSWQEKAEKHDEVDAQKSQHGRHHETAPAGDLL